jgi:hypothetical protein
VGAALSADVDASTKATIFYKRVAARVKRRIEPAIAAGERWSTSSAQWDGTFFSLDDTLYKGEFFACPPVQVGERWKPSPCRQRRCEPLIAAAEVIGHTPEGKTERQKNPHPARSLSWVAWIAARLGGVELPLQAARSKDHAKPVGPGSPQSLTATRLLWLQKMSEFRRDVERGQRRFC